MHSDCFQATKTDHSKDFISSDEGILRPKWKEPVAKIVPIMTDQSYIEQQYIFMMLKSTDSDEPYAECCIALGSVISPIPQAVTRELIHQGLSVGELELVY
jgi:hypothetical protein